MTATPSELAWQDAERAAARWTRHYHPGTWLQLLRTVRQARGLPPDATLGRPPKQPSERQPI